MSFAIPIRCSCDAPLWRIVFGLDTATGGSERVVACARCGIAGALRYKTEEIPYDERGAVRIVGFEVKDMDASALAWLSAWPRCAGDVEALDLPAVRFFLPSTSRFADEASLLDAERNAREAGAGKRYTDLLVAAGVPSEAPPSSLGSAFRFFRLAWEFLRLPEDTPLADLIDRADPKQSPASWICEDRLPEGDALVVAVAALVGDEDQQRRRIGIGALNILRQRSPNGKLVMPDAIVTAASARITALDPKDDQRRYLRHVLSAYDADVLARLPE